MVAARFSTASQVYEAFPAILRDMAAPPTDEEPLAFLAKLLAGRSPEDAVTFCAYLLDKRQAVWWAIRCLRELGLPRSREEEVPLKLAEAWVRDPEEHRRVMALQLGLDGDHNLAPTWAALAAGSAGGTMRTGDMPGPPVPAHGTARSVRVAVLVALAAVPIRDRSRRLTACVDLGRALLKEPAKT
jgi:hypothetical protein